MATVADRPKRGEPAGMTDSTYMTSHGQHLLWQENRISNKMQLRRSRKP